MINLSHVTHEKKTLFLCINYQANADARALVANLDELQGAEQRLDVILAFTGARHRSDPTFTDLKMSRARFEVLNLPDNPGYFGGAERALQHYLLQNDLPEWVVVSNVDLQIADLSFLNELENLGEKPPSVVAPRIISARSGRDQNPYMRTRPTVQRMHFYKWVFNTPGLCWAYQFGSGVKQKLKQSNRPDHVPPAQSEAIYAPQGSCIIFHKSFFVAGGHLRHPQFLFGEEIFVAEQARTLGLEVRYCPQLVLEHREHADTGLYPSRRMRNYIADATRYLADHYFVER